jgi:hypothetical protein
LIKLQAHHHKISAGICPMTRFKMRAVKGVVFGTTIAITNTVQIGASSTHTTDNTTDRLRFACVARRDSASGAACGAAYGLSFTA